MEITYTKIVDDYIKWIKDNTYSRGITGDDTGGAIITPFLDNHNDHIEIYFLKTGDHYRFSDGGETFANLEMAGVKLDSPKREKIYKTILNSFGVKTGLNDELYIEVNNNNLGQKKHYLLQAIMSINDMYVLSRENVASLFKEDVETYFISNDIIFSKDIKLIGKTGYDHNIDFLIPAHRDEPEKLIITANKASENLAKLALFTFNDIRNLRERDTRNYVIYNDTSVDRVPFDFSSALESYEVKSVPWSRREEYKEDFKIR